MKKKSHLRNNCYLIEIKHVEQNCCSWSNEEKRHWQVFWRGQAGNLEWKSFGLERLHRPRIMTLRLDGSFLKQTFRYFFLALYHCPTHPYTFTEIQKKLLFSLQSLLVFPLPSKILSYSSHCITVMSYLNALCIGTIYSFSTFAL